MKDFIKTKSDNDNLVDDLIDAILNVMKYGDSTVEYPDLSNAKIDDGVIAEWFYPVMNGSNDFSELTAIHTYVLQESKFEEIGELMLGISMVEMKHYSKLCDFVKNIGGNIEQNYNTTGVVVGATKEEAIDIAITSEQKTIEYYEHLKQRLLQQDTKTVRIGVALINKLIADEKVHLDLLQQTKTKQ